MSKQLFGIEPATIVLPFYLNQYLTLLQRALYWQVFFEDLIGQIDNYFPSDLIFQFFQAFIYYSKNY